MKLTSCTLLTLALLFCPIAGLAKPPKGTKTYKHVAEYQVAILDEHTQTDSATDLTWGANGNGQGVHLLHTDAGNYRVESPINKGLTMLSAMGSTTANPAVTYHNKWFLDNVQPGTKVLFASSCSKPHKNRPNDAVHCTFFFPDPDSTEHEFATAGDFTPASSGDGSNTQTTANKLCGTGKLKADVEAQLCSNNSASSTDSDDASTPATKIAVWDPLPNPRSRSSPSLRSHTPAASASRSLNKRRHPQPARDIL